MREDGQRVAATTRLFERSRFCFHVATPSRARSVQRRVGAEHLDQPFSVWRPEIRGMWENVSAIRRVVMRGLDPRIRQKRKSMRR
jgi:hypothetical protein